MLASRAVVGRLTTVDDRLDQDFSRRGTNAGSWFTNSAPNETLSDTFEAILVTSGVAMSSQPSRINQFYDPDVEFLELGVSADGLTTWKLHRPDLIGTDGGMNGTGGLGAIIPDALAFWFTIADAQGKMLGWPSIVGTGGRSHIGHFRRGPGAMVARGRWARCNRFQGWGRIWLGDPG